MYSVERVTLYVVDNTRILGNAIVVKTQFVATVTLLLDTT